MNFHSLLTLRHWYYLFGDLDYWYEEDNQDWFEFEQMSKAQGFFADGKRGALV